MIWNKNNGRYRLLALNPISRRGAHLSRAVLRSCRHCDAVVVEALALQLCPLRLRGGACHVLPSDRWQHLYRSKR